MRVLETLIRSIAALIVLPVLLLGVSAVAIVQRTLGQPHRQVQWAYRTFSAAFLGIAGTRLLVHGREHVAPGASFVVVSNHESNLDPFAIMAALPRLCIRFVIKRQIMQVPVFGRALHLTGNVTVDRRAGSGDVKRIQAGMASRDPSVSLLFFAEGTRARDGAFRPFKKGAFATAIAEKLPVLPIALAGTYRSLPPGLHPLRRSTVVVEIGAPVPTHDLALEDRDELLQRVEDAVGELRRRARRRVRQAGDEPGGVD